MQNDELGKDAMATKKVSVPKVVVAREDAEEVREEYKATGEKEVIEVEDTPAEAKIPAIVLELAHQKGEEPWTWFVADDHVSIVMVSGKKYRFDRES